MKSSPKGGLFYLNEIRACPEIGVKIKKKPNRRFGAFHLDYGAHSGSCNNPVNKDWPIVVVGWSANPTLNGNVFEKADFCLSISSLCKLQSLILT